MSQADSGLYGVMRGLTRVALGFYFSRIEKFHPERVPLTGPVLFASNHPNSLTDALVISATIPRKVNFVATAQLFRAKPLKWLLTQCGLIPINRVQDDPRAMRSVLATFEACYAVLERGEAVGIFPEGITHDDPQLKEVKSGTARMALELEHRHGGNLGLLIAPVGLTLSAKEKYRSGLLVHFGEPIRVADHLAGYEEKKKECIAALSAEISARLEQLILHLPALDRASLVAAIKRLYLDRLRIGNSVIREPVTPQAEELILTQAITSALAFACEKHPDVIAQFRTDLDRYERWLARLHISDGQLAAFPKKGSLLAHSLGCTALGILLLPVAIYGGIHRLLPALAVRWAVRRYATVGVMKARISTTAIIAGIVSFGVFYGAFIALVHRWLGWPASGWYALSLPVASLVANGFFREAGILANAVRTFLILLRAPVAARKLLRQRAALIATIEAEQRAYYAATGRREIRHE